MHSHIHRGIQGDKGLVATSKAAHHAISSLFDNAFDPAKEGGLVVQYEVKLQNGLECGGAYLKLLTESPEVRHIVFNSRIRVANRSAII